MASMYVARRASRRDRSTHPSDEASCGVLERPSRPLTWRAAAALASRDSRESPPPSSAVQAGAVPWRCRPTTRRPRRRTRRHPGSAPRSRCSSRTASRLVRSSRGRRRAPTRRGARSRTGSAPAARADATTTTEPSQRLLLEGAIVRPWAVSCSQQSSAPSRCPAQTIARVSARSHAMSLVRPSAPTDTACLPAPDPNH